MKSPITIVGAGQVGSLLAYKLLKRGRSVRILDSRSKFEKKNNQIPWGWFRKFSLQSQVKKQIMTEKFPIDLIDESLINKTKGPMLISSRNKTSIDAWREWIKSNSETDARVFSPKESEDLFNINKKYLGSKGGVFMCDSRDYLMDFTLLNQVIWEYLKQNEKCEFIESCEIKSIKLDKYTNIATHLITKNNELIEIDKAICCIGNQTQKVLGENVPIINITLPYAMVSGLKPKNYVALWNKNSAINIFDDSTVKLACGVNSIFDLKTINPYNIHNFANMGFKGLSNIYFKVNETEMIKMALHELPLIGIDEKIEIKFQTSCTTDMTPNLCPYIYFVPKAKNILSVNGLSASGSMVIDDSFMNLLIDSIEKQRLNKTLEAFNPKNNRLLDYWFIPKNKQTPLSSIM